MGLNWRNALPRFSWDGRVLSLIIYIQVKFNNKKVVSKWRMTDRHKCRPTGIHEDNMPASKIVMSIDIASRKWISHLKSAVANTALVKPEKGPFGFLWDLMGTLFGAKRCLDSVYKNALARQSRKERLCWQQLGNTTWKQAWGVWVRGTKLLAKQISTFFKHSSRFVDTGRGVHATFFGIAGVYWTEHRGVINV